MGNQRVNPLPLLGLEASSWLISGSEGPWSETPPWLEQRVLVAEGPSREQSRQGQKEVTGDGMSAWSEEWRRDTILCLSGLISCDWQPGTQKPFEQSTRAACLGMIRGCGDLRGCGLAGPSWRLTGSEGRYLHPLGEPPRALSWLRGYPLRRPVSGYLDSEGGGSGRTLQSSTTSVQLKISNS